MQEPEIRAGNNGARIKLTEIVDSFASELGSSNGPRQTIVNLVPIVSPTPSKPIVSPPPPNKKGS